VKIQTLPMYREANYKYIIVLDDVAYSIGIRWNVRSEHWFLSLYTPDSLISIVDSRKVVVQVNLLDKAYSNINSPQGMLVVAGNAKPLTFDSVGLDHNLYYLS